MAAYRADIEIGVSGARSLEQLRSSINQTARAVDSLNDVVSARGSLVQSIQNYTNNLNRAAQSLQRVGAGTEAETKAVREYVRALGEANTARARQNALVAQEIANQRRVTPGNAGYGQQGPALPPTVIRGQQIQQNWNRFFTDAAQVAQELQSVSAAKQTNIKTNWNRFFTDAAQVAQELQSVSAAKQVNVKNSWVRFFAAAQEVAVELTVQAQKTAAAIRSSEGLASAGARQRLASEAARRQLIQNAGFGVQGPALPPTSLGSAQGGRGISGRLGGAISGAVIGGAFPLLFGQGGGAAAGGAIGGLLGGLVGPGGSFAGSLLGTLLGDIASRGQAVKELADDIGFSAEQTKQLSDAFKIANTDVEKFTAVIQNIRGLGLEIEDQAKAIELVTRLTESYGGSFEKTGNAITSALESGKVTQATLNQLTSQGINIQQALADKYNVNRDAILKMAKDGSISVQSLIDTLVDLGNAPGKAAKQTQTASQLFQSAIQNLTKVVGPELERLTNLFLNFGATALNALTSVLTRLGQVGTAIENKIAGSTLKNAQQQFRRDAQTLKGLYAVPKAERTQQQVKQITSLENLQKGRMQVIQAAQPAKVEKLQTFPVPSQAMPSGGAKKESAGSKAADAEARIQAEIQALAIETNANQKQLEIKQKINAAEIAGDEQLAVRLQGEERTQQILADLQKSLIGITDERKRQAVIAKAASEIDVQQAATAGELAKIDNQRVKAIEDVLSGLDKELVALDATTDVKQQALKFLEIENELKKQGITLTNADAEAIRKKIAEIQKATKAQEEATAKLQMEKELFDGISSAIASTFSGAIDAAVQGTENLGDALTDLGTDLLATIGNMLIMYGIAQALGALGGGDSVGIFSSLATAFGYKGAKDGAYWPGGFKAFAEGGLVTSPTMGLIGEGGEPEYVIPASKMSAAMSRYASGARGSSVIPATGDNMTGDGGGSANTFTLETVVINNVEYATVDQVRSMGQRAASQGAQGGFSKSMRTLQNSRSQRSRLGLR